MDPRLSALERPSSPASLGRSEIVFADHGSCTVIVLEFVFRSEDITVWFASRTLALMDRRHFLAWLWDGGDYVIDDLAWSVEGTSALLTIDGNRTYVLDEDSLTVLAAQV